jgi:protoporphyrinogen IX oxidase
MPGLLVLHIVAVLCWCAAQLYLPALIAGRSSADKNSSVPHVLPRLVFTRISTPAALITIVSGTVIFAVSRTLEVWLMVKLGLVAALVITHALSGWLLLRAEVRPGPRIMLACGVLGAVLAVLMTAIIWVVLAKPLSAQLS